VSPPLLEANRITVRFGGVVALNEVTAGVHVGERLGIVGANGAGKTTLFAVLSGLLKPHSGDVCLEGRVITRMTPQERAAGGLARTFQRVQLFPELTVREHLVLAYRMRHGGHSLVRDLLGLGRSRSSSSPEESARVGELVARLGLSEVANRPAANLPLSTARLVEVGRALATEPRVVLLDEPTSGLHSNESAALGEVLRWASEEQKVALVLVEHDFEFVMGLAEHVVALDFGRVIATGRPAEVRADPAVAEAYVGFQRQVHPS
jgi:ABC-type branched-subunit amino acid transport system ATPase component